MKDKFLIGELARLFNISTDTLRYYGKIGLMKPEEDVKNGYRYYSVRKVFELSRILFFKSLDISLKDIKKYMSNKNRDNLLTLLKRKETEIDAKIDQLVNLKKKISSKLELLENIDYDINQIKIKRFPEGKGIFLNIGYPKNDFEIKQSLINNKEYMKISSWLIEGQVYASMAKEDILKGNFNKYRYFINIVEEHVLHGEAIVIPENDYACIVFLGPLSKKIGHYYETLVHWIEENGYEIVGDSIEKNIVDYDFSSHEEEFITEIQIPVTRNN